MARRQSVKKPVRVLFRRLAAVVMTVAILVGSLEPGLIGTRTSQGAAWPTMASDNSVSPDDYWTLDRFAATANAAIDWLAQEPSSALPIAGGESILAVTSGATSITAGDHHTCAVVDGFAECWGNGIHGELGNGYSTGRLNSVSVLGFAGDAVSIGAGMSHSCASTGSEVRCWGYNDAGQVGTSGDTYYPNPVAVLGLTAPISAVVTGGSHSCALAGSGGVECWGSDSYGQLGDGEGNDSGSTPRPVTGMTSGVRAIATGGNHTCAVDSAGKLYCWGDNSSGQIGINQSTVPKVEYPGKVTYIGRVTAVDAGASHTCAVTETGGVKCWGGGSKGQLGVGSGVNSSIKPVDVVGLASGVQSVVTGDEHSCALLVGGSVKCWASAQESGKPVH